MGGILLTGATGFIGGFIVEALLDQSLQVIALVRPNSDTRRINKKGVSIISIDLADVEAISQCINEYKITHIIHNAGLTKASSQGFLDEVNVALTARLLEAAKLSSMPISRFIHISSLAAYGPAELQPDKLVSLVSQPNPLTMYGKSKLAGEKVVINSAVPYVILRPTAVYGPYEKDLKTIFDLIKKGISPIIGSGSQLLSFIYVKDLAQYVVAALQHGPINSSYFVAETQTYTQLEFNNMIAEAAGKSAIKIYIPLSVVKWMSVINEKIGRLFKFYPTLNKDKYNEIGAKSWKCDTLPLARLNYQAQYPLKRGIIETLHSYK